MFSPRVLFQTISLIQISFVADILTDFGAV